MKGRRDFFKNIIKPIKNKKEDRTFYPPYFNEILDFEKCKSCMDKPCVNICEEKIIKIEKEKPILDFSKSGCSFCDKCAEVCEKGVLDIKQKKDIGYAKIDILKCIAWNKTVCSLCSDICEEKAIKFFGFFNPEIDNDLCNGCGFCLNICPTFAIDIKKGALAV